jgi:hypothetical protein
MSKRKRGGQPGNRNALKHGRFSAPLRAARRIAILEAAELRRPREQEWAARMPVIDYDAICEEIRRSSRFSVRG